MGAANERISRNKLNSRLNPIRVLTGRTRNMRTTCTTRATVTPGIRDIMSMLASWTRDLFGGKPLPQSWAAGPVAGQVGRGFRRRRNFALWRPGGGSAGEGIQLDRRC